MTSALAIALVVVGLGVVASYGWHLMTRANRDKAALLTTLVGHEATLLIQGEAVVLPHRCLVLRVEDGLVVVRELPPLLTPEPQGALVPRPSRLDERVFALGAIREVRQDFRSLGHW
jgi:hypothetical protein